MRKGTKETHFINFTLQPITKHMVYVYKAGVNFNMFTWNTLIA